MFSDCETPDLPENAKQIVCQKSTCGFICNEGFQAVGKKRISCRKGKLRSAASWTGKLGSCKACDPIEPGNFRKL